MKDQIFYNDAGEVIPNYRSSELGGCIKMLTAKRLGMKPMATPATMVKIFDKGHRHETACVATMQAEGWIIEDQQKEFLLPMPNGTVVSGHLDGTAFHEDMPQWRVLEAKSPGAWAMFLNEMYSDDPSPMIQRYKWQISCYMHAEQKEALFVTLDDTFTVRIHGIEVPFYTLDDIRTRVEMVENLAASGYAGLPKFCDPREYPCQYFHLHEDEESTFDIDSELDAAVNRYDRARERLDDAKKKLAHEKEILIGTMGTRTKVATDNSLVSLYTRNSTSYDYKKMRQDGIDIDQYKKVSTSDLIPRVTKKGKSDEDNTGPE